MNYISILKLIGNIGFSQKVNLGFSNIFLNILANPIEDQKFMNLWKFKNTFLKNQWIKENTKEIKKYLEINENEIHQNTLNTMKAQLREIYSCKCLY